MDRCLGTSWSDGGEAEAPVIGVVPRVEGGIVTAGGGKAAASKIGSILTVTLEGCEGCLGLGLDPLNRITQVRPNRVRFCLRTRHF